MEAAQIFSIEGIDPSIAVATKGSDGKPYLNVASGLPERKQRIAKEFAQQHHENSAPPIR